MPHGQKGFAHIAIIGIVLLLGIAGVFVWYTLDNDDAELTDVPEKNAGDVATCSGLFFDTHAHLDSSSVAVKLAENMRKHSVSCSVLFTQMNPDNYDEDHEMAYDDIGDAPNVFVPFYDIVRDHQTIVTDDYLQKLITENDGKFKGFGEFALYRQELAGTDLTQEPWQTIFSFAQKNSLVVMIHLSAQEQDTIGLETMLDAYPNTKVLIHGIEHSAQEYIDLLNRHPNLYYTLDTATLLLLKSGIGVHLMYPNPDGNADTFLSNYAQYKSALMQQAKDDWAQLIIAVPDRIMWGTDVSFDWHTDPAVYDKLIEFSTEFIQSLPADVQDKYAYQNAVKLLGNSAIEYPQQSHDDGGWLENLLGDDEAED